MRKDLKQLENEEKEIMKNEDLMSQIRLSERNFKEGKLKAFEY